MPWRGSYASPISTFYLVRWIEPGRKTRSPCFHTEEEAAADKGEKEGEALIRRVLDANYRAPLEIGRPLDAADSAFRSSAVSIACLSAT